MDIKKKYATVIFDLDGTLLNTLEDLKNSTNFALSEMGFPQRRIDEVRKFVGNGVKKLIEKAVPDNTDEKTIEKTLTIFKKHYAENSEVYTKPYDGILELLDQLISYGFRIAVVSNKIDSVVKTLCRKYFGDRIPVAIGEKEGIAKKPAPDTVNEALACLYTHHFDAIYIGDSEVDIETAKNAKMDHISVTWGFRDEKFLLEKGAKNLAHVPMEILTFLLF